MATDDDDVTSCVPEDDKFTLAPVAAEPACADAAINLPVSHNTINSEASAEEAREHNDSYMQDNNNISGKKHHYVGQSNRESRQHGLENLADIVGVPEREKSCVSSNGGLLAGGETMDALCTSVSSLSAGPRAPPPSVSSSRAVSAWSAFTRHVTNIHTPNVTFHARRAATSKASPAFLDVITFLNRQAQSHVTLTPGPAAPSADAGNLAPDDKPENPDHSDSLDPPGSVSGSSDEEVDEQSEAINTVERYNKQHGPDTRQSLDHMVNPNTEVSARFPAHIIMTTLFCVPVAWLPRFYGNCIPKLSLYLRCYERIFIA